jgi:hypothetical protein
MEAFTLLGLLVGPHRERTPALVAPLIFKGLKRFKGDDA